MSVLTLEAKLERTDRGTPWGFRMQGGKDYASPLTIQRVTPGSLAAKCGLQAGDIILKIGNAAAEPLKHKDAQDIIVSCPNRLDLLLQRGGSTIQPAYDKFPVNQFAGASSPGQGSFQSSQNFNAAPKPFGAPSPAAPAAPAPAPSFSSPSVNSLSQQTQNMNISSSQTPDYLTAAQRYTEREAAPDPTQNQSRSFKFLQGLMDSGQEAPTAFGQPPAGDTPGTAGSSQGKVKAIMAQKYNNPIGLYSNTNVERELEGQSKFLVKDPSGNDEPSPAPTFGRTNGTSTENNFQPEKRAYYPSETFKLVQEEENKQEKGDQRFKPAQSRSLKMLQEQLDSGGGVTPGQAAGGAKHTGWAPPKPAPAPVSANTPAAKPWAPSAPAPPPFAPAKGPAMGGPMGGPVGGSIGGPVGGSIGGPVGGSMGGPVGGSMGGPMGGSRGAPPKPTGKGATKFKKGDAVVRQQGATGADIPRVATCAQCGNTIRGPFVVAMGKTWCPDHFICANARCGVKLIDIGFVEEGGYLYCERDYELYFAPKCTKCSVAIVGECVNALQKSYHPQCFLCFQCKQPIGGNQFHIEDGNPYCEKDWNAMFQTMCSGCSFPIEPGDKWVEAMGQNFHSECFNCSTCQVSLEGAPFYVKAGKPFCKKHVR